MAIDADDWTIDRDTGNIRYTGDDHGGASPTYATVLELHRWLQGLADDAKAVPADGDELDITNTDPSKRFTDNYIQLYLPYNIDDGASEHLYDGSVVQDDGDTIYDGIVNFGASTVQIEIHQNGAVLSDNWWNYGGGGLNADATAGISHRFMLKTREDGVDIDKRKLIGISRTFGNSYHEFIINATARGNNVLALSDSDDLNNETAEGTVATWSSITNTEGLRNIDVNNDGTDEEYYSEWNRDTYTINQLYERLKYLTRDDATSTELHGIDGNLFRGITHSFAYDGEAGGITPATNDKLVWGTRIYCPTNSGTFTVGEAVHEDTATPAWKGRVLAWDAANDYLLIEHESGTITDTDTFTGISSSATGTVSGSADAPQAGSSSGECLLLAVDDQGATGNLYVQVLKGPAPVDNTRMYDDGDLTDYLDVAGSVTERAISVPFCGVSTGSALIGAYGVGVEYADLSKDDKLTDLTGTQRTPPNQVTNTVGSLASGEDYVFVGPWDGSSYDDEGNPAVNKDQLSLNTALTTDDIGSVIVDEAAPHGTPDSGTIRVTDNNGYERRLEYSGYTGTGPTTFTITTTDGNEDFNSVNASIGNDVYITYIDKLAASSSESWQAVHTSGTDNLVVKVRDGGGTPIKEFIQAWTFTSSSQTLNAIRTSDA